MTLFAGQRRTEKSPPFLAYASGSDLGCDRKRNFKTHASGLYCPAALALCQQKIMTNTYRQLKHIVYDVRNLRRRGAPRLLWQFGGMMDADGRPSCPPNEARLGAAGRTLSAVGATLATEVPGNRGLTATGCVVSPRSEFALRSRRGRKRFLRRQLRPLGVRRPYGRYLRQSRRALRGNPR